MTKNDSSTKMRWIRTVEQSWYLGRKARAAISGDLVAEGGRLPAKKKE